VSRSRNISDEQKSILTCKLEYLKQYYLGRLVNSDESFHGHLLTPINFVCSFNDIQESQVLQHCTKLFTLHDIYSYIDIWEPDVANDIFFILHLIFGDVDYKECTTSNDESTEIQCAQVQEMMDAWHLTSDDELLLEFPDEFSNLSDED
jgi:hypothetical protein